MLIGNPCKFPCLFICPTVIFPTLFRRKWLFDKKNLLKIMFPVGFWPHQLQHVITEFWFLLVLTFKAPVTNTQALCHSYLSD